jgi:hypothetical protein
MDIRTPDKPNRTMGIQYSLHHSSDNFSLLFAHLQVHYEFEEVKYFGFQILKYFDYDTAFCKRNKIKYHTARVQFPVLQAFLRSSGSGTGSTQPSAL